MMHSFYNVSHKGPNDREGKTTNDGDIKRGCEDEGKDERRGGRGTMVTPTSGKAQEVKPQEDESIASELPPLQMSFFSMSILGRYYPSV